MVSNPKRMKYVDDTDFKEATSTEESCDDEYSSGKTVRSKSDYILNPTTFLNHFQLASRTRRGRKPKCFSKNALLARENRLRKKMYLAQLESNVESLRSDNKKLSAFVNNQSDLIAELKKEVKYLKSVIVNSKDISRLIRNINQSSGMSVSSSLDENLSLNNVYIPKPKHPVSRKVAHPWDENALNACNLTPNSSPDQGLCEDFDNEFFNLNLDFDLGIPESDLLTDISFNKKEIAKPFEEHNYTLTNKTELETLDDVGVCLHVSKHHVSLEFCSSCSEKASEARST